MPKQSPTGPKSVLGKTKLLLDQFSVERPRLTLTDFVQGSGLAKPTCYRLLQELTELGIVSQPDRHYQLGLAAFRYGLIARQQLQLEDIFSDLLKPLAQETGETVIIATLDNDEMLYLHVIESPSPLRYVVGSGARRALPFGATALALLSQLTEGQVTALLQEPFPAFTDRTITTLAAYLKRLQQVAQDQLAIEIGEYYEGIMAIAVPVPHSRPLAFTVVGPEERVRPHREMIIEQLDQAAAEFARLDVVLPL